jgi:hypothetical protein
MELGKMKLLYRRMTEDYIQKMTEDFSDDIQMIN